MYGALLGDMIGAPYEFDMGDKTKEFPLSLRQSAGADSRMICWMSLAALISPGSIRDRP